MGIFGGKSDKDKDKDKKNKKKKEEGPQLPKIPSPKRSSLFIPRKKKVRIDIDSREYKIFRQKETVKLGWYERLCRLSAKILTMKASDGMKKDLEQAIAFTSMRITPDNVMSLMVMTIIFFAAMTPAVIVLSIVPIYLAILLPLMGVGLAYYFMKYPTNYVKKLRIQASSQVVLAILYMVISMRISPNLERALSFSASNVSGPLAWDMRRLLWDIEMRKYYSAADAMTDYIAKWKSENEEFSEALRLIRESETHSPQRATVILDQALEVILDGTKVRMKHYAQDLQLPVTIIHMMGILLPVMGTIMAPLAAVFLSDLVGPIHFIIGYNIALPIMLLWFINTTLGKRPMTFSQIELKNHPGIPKKGCFLAGKSNIPVMPIAIIVLIAMVAFPIFYFYQNPELIFLELTKTMTGAKAQHGPITLMLSGLIILGIAFSFGIYFILTNYQKASIKDGIQKTESEFELALFQLGNRISGGTPTEVAIGKSVDDMKDLEIANLFRITLRNIQTLGMTFSQALFDRKYGAMIYYPSRLIRNVMFAVVDTAKTGIKYASESMLRIAKYMKNIRETQEYIRDLLSETVSSMTFQAYFLSPMITGLIVSMADIITNVLTTLGCYLDTMDMGSAMGLESFTETFNMKPSTSPEVFQLIIGFYIIQVLFILGIFLTKISKGDDSVSQWLLIGKMLILGTSIYFIVAIISSFMFADLIGGALAGLGFDGTC